VKTYLLIGVIGACGCGFYGDCKRNKNKDTSNEFDAVYKEESGRGSFTCMTGLQQP